MDSQCTWYRTVLFWSAYLGFPSKMDRGSIIMDRVFWIDYFGSDRGAAWSRDRRAYCAVGA